MQLLLIKLYKTSTLEQLLPEVAVVTNKQKIASFAKTDWNDLHAMTSGKKVVVFIPTEDVLLTSVDIPSTNKKQLLQAVPYALEERLADDIESLHFTIHTEKDNNLTHVAIISHQKMESWLELLRKHNIFPHFILPNLYAITIQPDSWTLIRKQNKSYLRQDKWSGFSCNNSLLPLFLAEELKNKENAPQTIYYLGDENHYPGELADIEKHQLNSDNIDHDDVVDALELNLLNGFNRGDSALFNVNWKPWLPAVSLATLLGILWLGMLSWKNHLLDNKLQNLEAEIESVYKQTFPNSRIQNASVQMSQKLQALQKNSGSTGGSTLQTISIVSPFLKKFKQIHLREIRYQNNELLFVISAPDITRLETFKNTLIKEGALKVEIKSSTTTANKVESTLVIKGVV
jgi:general secretion pathway protein L